MTNRFILRPSGNPLAEHACHRPENSLVLRDSEQLIDAISSYFQIPFTDPDFITQLQKPQQFTPNCQFLYQSEAYVTLAKAITEATKTEMMILGCSGSDAVETAMKIAYQATASARRKPRQGFVTARRAYHGSSALALVATDSIYAQAWFSPLATAHVAQIGDWAFCEQFDESTANAELGKIPWENVAAVLIEFVQGVGGVRKLNERAYQLIHAAAKSNRCLVIADEVTTGLGRVSWPYMTISQTLPLSMRPDVIVLGKGLGAGLYPISAVLLTQEVIEKLENSTQLPQLQLPWGQTCAGTGPGCHIATEVIKRLQTSFKNDPDLPSRLKQRLEEYFEKFRGTLIDEVRIQGNLASLVYRKGGIDGQDISKLVTQKALEKGVLTSSDSEATLIAFPFDMSEEAIKGALDILKKVLQEF